MSISYSIKNWEDLLKNIFKIVEFLQRKAYKIFLLELNFLYAPISF